MPGFEIIVPIANTETIAAGKGIRELERLKRQNGKGRWRKRKGIARIRLDDGTVLDAEIHLRGKQSR